MNLKPNQTEVAGWQLEIFMLKAQKPGGFDPKTELPLLLTILESAEFLETHSDEVALVMQNVLATSDLLYMNLMDRYPKLKTLSYKVPSPESAQCRHEDETKELLKFSADYLKQRLKTTTERATVSEYDFMAPLSPLLSKLSQFNQDQLIRSTKRHARLLRSLLSRALSLELEAIADRHA